jgi:hypothetical protein
MVPRDLLVIAALMTGLAVAQPQSLAPDALPATAAAQLAKSLEAARAHSWHVWRDTPPRNPAGGDLGRRSETRPLRRSKIRPLAGRFILAVLN